MLVPPWLSQWLFWNLLYSLSRFLANSKIAFLAISIFSCFSLSRFFASCTISLLTISVISHSRVSWFAQSRFSWYALSRLTHCAQSHVLYNFASRDVYIRARLRQVRWHKYARIIGTYWKTQYSLTVHKKHKLTLDAVNSSNASFTCRFTLSGASTLCTPTKLRSEHYRTPFTNIITDRNGRMV